MGRGFRRGLILVTLAAAYFVAGRLGLSLAFVHSSASAVWPATGVALAAALLFGSQVWPAVAAGAFLVNLTTSGSLTASAGMLSANSLEALAGARLLQRYGGASAALTAQGIFRLAAYAGMAATLAATIGLASLAVSGLMGPVDPGTIWITWWLGDVTGAILVAGIEPEFLPHVFEQFTQSDASTTRAHAGLGLGLSIVQRIVDLHKGTVTAANRSDRSGAVFTVSLPAAVSAPA